MPTPQCTRSDRHFRFTGERGSIEAKRGFHGELHNDLHVRRSHGVVWKLSTGDRPSGLGSVVVKGLLKKYRLLDVVSLVEVRQRLENGSRKRRADPSTLFQQLRAISNQLTVPGKPLDQSYLMAAILVKATYEYKVVTSTERRIKGPELLISDLEV